MGANRTSGYKMDLKVHVNFKQMATDETRFPELIQNVLSNKSQNPYYKMKKIIETKLLYVILSYL